MCRLLAYKGHPVILDDLLYEPEHSLIKQSFHATEMEEPLNGDGFGVGWYNKNIDDEPALFRSVQPAWNNLNLQYISPKISSECVFAHVRSASVGIVNQLNCHPFHCGNFLMMHNGGIKNFETIRRPLLAKLSDETFRSIEGQTDSEHIFALFLEHLHNDSDKDKLSTYLEALKTAINDIIELKKQHELTEASTLNIFITDGSHIIGCRYIIGSDQTPLSLYFANGGRFECKDNMYTLREDTGKDKQAVLFVSEKLNAHAQDWQKVPENHFFTVNKQGTITFTEITI